MQIIDGHPITQKLIAETVERLDGLNGSDPEAAHASADEILLDHLRTTGHAAVAEAFERCCNRAGGFWYA